MTSGMSTWRDSSSGAGEIHIRWFLEDRSPLWCPGTHHVINSLTSPPGVCRLVGWEPAQACPLCRCIFSLQTRAPHFFSSTLTSAPGGQGGKIRPESPASLQPLDSRAVRPAARTDVGKFALSEKDKQARSRTL